MASHLDASLLTAALTELVSAVTRVANAVGELDGDRPEYTTASRLGVSARTLRRLVAEGEIDGFAVGREIHVRAVDWDTYVARRRIAPKTRRATKAQPHVPSAPANAYDDFAALIAGAAQ